MMKKIFATSFIDGFSSSKFSARARKINVPEYFEVLPRKKFRPDLELLLFWRVLIASLSSSMALLYSSRGYTKPELLACIAIGLIPKKFRPIVVLYGEMFQPDGNILGFIEHIVMKLVDRGVSLYIVFSTAELELFPKLWGVDMAKMRFCPFYINDKRIRKRKNSKSVEKHIFAGGNSHRDFGPVIEAAKQLPEFEFILATKKISKSYASPPNVRIDWMSLDEYLDLIDTAAVVLVPLKTGLNRTAGLLTVFESFVLGKLIIVPDAFGIRDYVTDGETGLVVSDLPDGYVKAIRWAFDPMNRDKVSRICINARQSISERFTLERHVENMLTIMDEALEIQEGL